MNNIKITIKKEIRSIVRDKKTFLTLLAMPLLGIFFVLLYGFMFDNTTTLSTYDIGIDYETNINEKVLLSEYMLKQENYKSLEELEKAYKNGDIDAYIHYDNEKEKYYFYTDSGQDGIQIQNLITTYFESLKSNELVNLITGEGIDYDEVVSKYNYEHIELPGTNFLLITIYSTLFMLIFTGVISTSQSMAISTTTTEKENGTLETILSFPISSKELIVGKYLANFIASLVASLLEFFSILITLVMSTKYFVSFKELNINLSISNIFIGILVCFVSSLIISALATLLVANTKSSKEAQIKLAILSYLSMIPMFTNILSITPDSIFYYMIPIVNCVQILMDIFSNNFSTLNILTTLISTVVLSIITIYLVIKKYKSEKVLFGV